MEVDIQDARRISCHEGVTSFNLQILQMRKLGLREAEQLGQSCTINVMVNFMYQLELTKGCLRIQLNISG